VKAWQERLLKRAVAALGVLAPSLAGEVALQIFTTPVRIPRPEWERKLVANGTPLKLRSGLNATAWGEFGRPVVLLVHGWQGRGSQLGLLAAPLVENGFRVVAIDGPAHGDSDGKRINVNMFSGLIANAAEELSSARGESVAVHAVAHSFGASATGLALVNGAPLKSAVLVASPSDFQKVVDLYVRRMGLSDRVKASFESRLAKWIKLKPGQSDLARAGTKVTKPVLIVHDPADLEVVFENAKRFVEYWPSARLLALEKVGHYKILKAPAFLQAAVDFLKSS
jgi:pimeloyl-ACP methyl ester carboxylesterase